MYLYSLKIKENNKEIPLRLMEKIIEKEMYKNERYETVYDYIGGYGDSQGGYHEKEWKDSERIFKSFSKKYPNFIFILECVDLDEDPINRRYFKDGQMTIKRVEKQYIEVDF